tara:strand:+ start:44 stop:694 length:651 start_codon:yes stop_codon:yes gene_type:complete
MGKKNKLQKFEDLKIFKNVLEFPEDIKGNWNNKVFKNNNPIILELACGKGDYSLAMAERFPEKNYIGVDIKGARIWVGANKALQEKQDNVAFLRAYIEDLINYFETEEIQEIWITFPDPYLKDSKAKKRLTSERFLKMYRALLPESGVVHLKTDSAPLFEFTLESIAEDKTIIQNASRNIYAEATLEPLLDIQTYYERMHLRDGRNIHYVRFQFVD